MAYYDYYPGIVHGKAKYSDYLTYKTRLQTFEDENDFNKALAKAGFYFKESSGSISCFYCGGSIRGLELGDDVWAQHAEYFPDCEFLKLHKGEKFIQRACDLAGREDTMKLGEDQDAESIDTDQMIEDLNSKPSLMIMNRGYQQEDVEQGILKAREKYGNGELKAAYILECIPYTESVKTSSKIYSTSPLCSTSSYQAPSPFAFPKMETTEALDKDHKKLLEENLELKSRKTCKICLDRDACVLFQPCHHMISCLTCAGKLKTCAVCRADITDMIRTYTA